MPKPPPDEVKLRLEDLQPDEGAHDLTVLLGDDLARAYDDVANAPISEELSALLAATESAAANR